MMALKKSMNRTIGRMWSFFSFELKVHVSEEIKNEWTNDRLIAM